MFLKNIKLSRKKETATLWAKYQVVPTTADQKATVPKAKNKVSKNDFFGVVNFDSRIKTRTAFIAPIIIETCCWVTSGHNLTIGVRRMAGIGGKGV